MKNYVNDNKCFEEFPDTEWAELAISGTGFTKGTPTPMWKKYGEKIYIKGHVSVDTTAASPITTIFATLPTGCRPSNPVYVLIPGQGDRQARLYINTNGNININYFKTYAGEAVTDGTYWIDIKASFFVDE